MPKGSFTCTMEIRNIITRIWWFKENFVYPELKITPQEIGLYVYTVGFFAFISKKNNLVYVWILSIYINRPKNTSTEHVSIILINHIFLILIWIRWLSTHGSPQHMCMNEINEWYVYFASLPWQPTRII